MRAPTALGRHWPMYASLEEGSLAAAPARARGVAVVADEAAGARPAPAPLLSGMASRPARAREATAGMLVARSYS
jgi:hypothetical protein